MLLPLPSFLVELSWRRRTDVENKVPDLPELKEA